MATLALSAIRRRLADMPVVRVVAKATLVVSAFYALDKVASLGLQFFIARAFGVGAELDAYNAANNLPDTLFLLISGGALNIAMIPLLRRELEHHAHAGMWRLFAHIANLAFSATAILAVCIFLFAPVLVAEVVAPGFSSEQQALTVALMRLNLLAALIFSISGLVMGSLQVHQSFFWPGLAPLMYDLGQMIGVIGLGPKLRLAESLGDLPVVGGPVAALLTSLSAALPDLGIFGLAWGVVLGAALHLAIQVPGLLRNRFSWRLGFGLRDPAMREMLIILGPRVLTMACVAGIFIINDRYASSLEEGAVSALSFGWRIQQIPQTLIGTAIAVALLPSLSALIANRETGDAVRLLRRALWVMLVLTVPITLVAIIGVPLVTDFVFDERAGLVALVTQGYLVGLVGHCVKEVTTRTFYVHQDARTPLLTAALNIALFSGLGWLLLGWLGPLALAVANSLAFTLEAGVQWWLLRRRQWL
jgi:putative peptidoglycan lipid II flippase